MKCCRTNTHSRSFLSSTIGLSSFFFHTSPTRITRSKTTILPHSDRANPEHGDTVQRKTTCSFCCHKTIPTKLSTVSSVFAFSVRLLRFASTMNTTANKATDRPITVVDALWSDSLTRQAPQISRVFPTRSSSVDRAQLIKAAIAEALRITEEDFVQVDRRRATFRN